MDAASPVEPLGERPASRKLRLPDLVHDSKLETRLGQNGDTIHTSRDASGQRGANQQERWRQKLLLGCGGGGAVWLQEKVTGGESSTPILRAVKAIQVHEPRGSTSRNRLSIAENYVRELEALAKFSQRKYAGCFVQFYGWWEQLEHPRHLLVAMEYCPLGDMQHHISSEGPLSPGEGQDITAQLLDGLGYMHQEGFAHRDLKPANILIKSSPPDRWWVVICDHGLSKRVGGEQISTTIVKGTPLFIAPELRGFYQDIAPTKADPYAADIWGLGETIYRILCDRPAFDSDDTLRRFALGSLQFPTQALQNSVVGNQAIDFLSRIMHPRPDRRLTCFQAREHGWVKDNKSPHTPAIESEVSSLNSLHLDPDPVVQLSTQRSESHVISPSAAAYSRDWTMSTNPFRNYSSEIPNFTIHNASLPNISAGSARTEIKGLTNDLVELTAIETRATRDGPYPYNELFDFEANQHDSSLETQNESNALDEPPDWRSAENATAVITNLPETPEKRFEEYTMNSQNVSNALDELSDWNSAENVTAVITHSPETPAKSEEYMMNSSKKKFNMKWRKFLPKLKLTSNLGALKGYDPGDPEQKYVSYFEVPEKNFECDTVDAVEVKAAVDLLRKMLIIDSDLSNCDPRQTTEVQREEMRSQSDAIFVEINRLVRLWDRTIRNDTPYATQQQESLEIAEIISILDEIGPRRYSDD